MTKRLYIFAAVTFLAGLYFLWLALDFPAAHEVSTLVGPRTWPLGVLVLMLVLVATMALLLWARGPSQFMGHPETDGPVLPENEPDTAVKRDAVAGSGWKHLVVLALAVGYTVLMTYVGYMIATALFAASTTVVLGERRPLRVTLNTVIAVLIVAVVFDRLLNIPLP